MILSGSLIGELLDYLLLLMSCIIYLYPGFAKRQINLKRGEK